MSTFFAKLISKVRFSRMNQKNEAPLPKGSGRIIVVDDEELLVRVNKRRLEYDGYTVTTTTDSEEALEKIRAHPEQFDLLITDQTMPKMSGVELDQRSA